MKEQHDHQLTRKEEDDEQRFHKNKENAKGTIVVGIIAIVAGIMIPFVALAGIGILAFGIY
jgi:hypothetical protein